MRPIVIVSGILGGGSALVFVAAALVASMFPTGALVPTQGWMNGREVMFDGPAVRGPLIFRGGPGMIDDTSGGGLDGVWVDVGNDIEVPPGVVVPDEVDQ